MIPLSVPNLSGKEWEYVKECLDTGWISSTGSFVEKFEKKMAQYLGIENTVALMNGTVALHMALMAAGVKRGELVIMPNVTFVAPANAISYIGAEPLLIDIHGGNWQMDIDLLEELLREDCIISADGSVYHRPSNKKISSILIVHVQGNICDMDRLLNLAKEFNLIVIEDAAEALGSKYKDVFAGTMGLFGCYSFNGNKIISTGGGGMIVCKDKDLLEQTRHVANTAKTDPITYYHDQIGYNYRLVNVLAAIGLAQAESLEKFVEKKIEIANFYRDKLKNIGDIKFQEISKDVKSNEWLFTISTKYQKELIQYLNETQIISRPFWMPVNMLPMYKECCYKNNENISEKVHSSCLTIPCSTGINNKELEIVVETICNFFEFTG